MQRINVKSLSFALLGIFAAPLFAADQPQWGEKFSRNMVSAERGLPDRFDPATGENVKWTAELGTHNYVSPIIANGHVLIGTNNDHPRDPHHAGDRAVLMCLEEKTGRLEWQFVSPKLSEDRKDPYLDWPQIGFASPPTVEGDRAYALTNRGEIACFDLKGMVDGNQGPYMGEATHAAPQGEPPVEMGPLDADVIWLHDLVAEAGIRTHDQVHGSILIDGDLLYVNSCNGVDNTHRVIRTPDAPALLVFDKKTGRIVARDDQRIGPDTFHVGWSSPSLGEVNGRKLIFLGGANGVCYAFDALKSTPPEGEVAKLHTVWKFDTDPTAPKQDIHKWVSNRREGPSIIYGMPVFVDGKIFLTSGGDMWWGKHQGWLKCIDANGQGDVTKTAEIWSFPLSRETTSTPAVADGLVYAADCGGTIYCVDAATGKPVWTHKANGDIWASPLVADGKVYIGTQRGQFLVLAAGREKKLLSEVNLGDKINGTATAANGVVYVPTMKRLFAFAQGAKGKPSQP